MACDPENSNKRCPATKELIFHYEGKNAILEKCKDACFKDERCIALSGKFSGNENTAHKHPNPAPLHSSFACTTCLVCA